MKKFKWWWGVGAVIVLWASIFTVRSCRITDAYSRMRGAYEEARRIAEADHAIQLKAIEAANAQIVELDKKLLSSEQVISDIRGLLTLKDAHLADLNDALGKARTDSERVPILTSMVETWKAKYADLEGVVVEKDKQLSAWGAKYAAQVTISDSWKAQYEAEHRLRLSGETLLGTLEGKYRRAKLMSSVKNVALVALVGATAFQFIKGK